MPATESSQSAAPAPRQHVVELDGIRGIACLLVLAEHCLVGLANPANSLLHQAKMSVVPLLVGGVDLFFVLSGFLIGGILMDAKKNGAADYYRSFWVRRAARILPALYVLLASYWLAVTLSAHFNWAVMDRWLLCQPHHPIWLYATFLQSIPMALKGYWSGGPYWLRPTWSLAVEEQFYLLFPFLVYVLRRRTVALLMLAAILIAPPLRVAVAHGWNGYAAYILLPCRFDCLAAGVLVAMAVRDAKIIAAAVRFRPVLDAVAIGALAGILSQQWIFRNVALLYSLMAVAFAIAIFRVFLVGPGPYRRILRSRVLTATGLISYSLYLYHEPVNGILHAVLLNDIPGQATAAQFGVNVLSIAAAVALATASYLLMERPIRQAAQRWIERRRAMEATAVAA